MPVLFLTERYFDRGWLPACLPLVAASSGDVEDVAAAADPAHRQTRDAFSLSLSSRAGVSSVLGTSRTARAGRRWAPSKLRSLDRENAVLRFRIARRLPRENGRENRERKRDPNRNREPPKEEKEGPRNTGDASKRYAFSLSVRLR